MHDHAPARPAAPNRGAPSSSPPACRPIVDPVWMMASLILPRFPPRATGRSPARVGEAPPGKVTDSAPGIPLTVRWRWESPPSRDPVAPVSIHWHNLRGTAPAHSDYLAPDQLPDTRKGTKARGSLVRRRLSCKVRGDVIRPVRPRSVRPLAGRSLGDLGGHWTARRSTRIGGESLMAPVT